MDGLCVRSSASLRGDLLRRTSPDAQAERIINKMTAIPEGQQPPPLKSNKKGRLKIAF